MLVNKNVLDRYIIYRITDLSMKIIKQIILLLHIFCTLLNTECEIKFDPK